MWPSLSPPLCLLVFYHTAIIIHLYIPRVPSQAVTWLFWCQVFVSEGHPVLLRETGSHSHCLLNKTLWFIICNSVCFAFTSFLPNGAAGLSAGLLQKFNHWKALHKHRCTACNSWVIHLSNSNMSSQSISQRFRHGFMKIKLHSQTSLLTFYEEMTVSVAKGRAVGITCFDFSDTFDTLP